MKLTKLEEDKHITETFYLYLSVARDLLFLLLEVLKRQTKSKLSLLSFLLYSSQHCLLIFDVQLSLLLHYYIIFCYFLCIVKIQIRLYLIKLTPEFCFKAFFFVIQLFISLSIKCVQFFYIRPNQTLSDKITHLRLQNKQGVKRTVIN